MKSQLLNRLFNKLAFTIPGGDSLRPMLQRKRGVVIGKNVWISQYVYFDELHPEGIIIGDNATIGIRSSIITHFYYGARQREGGFKPVIIEDDVFIGPHCLILPGVRIGRGSVIKGSTTVTRNVPEETFISAPDAKAVARATVPITPEHSFDEFMLGLRPLKQKRKQKVLVES